MSQAVTPARERGPKLMSRVRTRWRAPNRFVHEDGRPLPRPRVFAGV